VSPGGGQGERWAREPVDWLQGGPGRERTRAAGCAGDGGAALTDAATSGPSPGPPEVTIPAGGKIAGYGETFSADDFTGTANFEIPIATSPGRRPLELALSYTSGGGNGPFGVGFSLDVGAVGRRTDRGVPRYDGTDTFLLGGQELVPALVATPEGWAVDEHVTTVDGVEHLVRRYRPRVDHDFTRIERWTSAAGEHWTTTSPDGTTTSYGRSADSRIADPADPAQVFQWLVDQTVDSHGDRVEYRYKAEDGVNARGSVADQHRSFTANRYLERIHYTNYPTGGGGEAFAFEVVFDYGEYDPAGGTVEPVRPWPARSDCFSTYRAGFEVRTCRLCRNVMMVSWCSLNRYSAPGGSASGVPENVFPEELGAPRLVAYTSFEYDDTGARALLVRTRRTGVRTGDDGTVATRSMPPIDLEYAPFDPGGQRFRELALEGAPVPGMLDDGRYRLVDLHGEGIPGVLYTDGATMLYWPPLGDGRYAPPEQLPVLPSEHALGTPAFTLTDLDGNGHLDLVVTEATRGGYYGDSGEGWAPYRAFDRWAPEYVTAGAQLVDLDGNGRADIYVQAGTATRYYPSLGTEGFASPVGAAPTQVLPTPALASERVVVQFADVFGDGMAHLVEVGDGNLTAWPNLGHGRFGPPVTFADAPAFGATLTADRVLLADTDGTGPADLVLVYADHLELHQNLSGNGFGPAVRIPVPFGIDELDRVAMADVLGNGTAALVVSKAAPQVTHFYLDFSAGVRPGQLVRMRNNFGLATEVSYRSSTDYYLADQRSGRPWVTRLSTPVSVVETVTTVDEIAATRTTRTFQYRDGWYDPVERAFRGFGFVQTQDTPVYNPALWHFPTGTAADVVAVEPAVTRGWRLTGAYAAGGAIEAQARAEQWDGDPEGIRLPPTSFSTEILAADAATIREAHVALADELVHQETFAVADDGSVDGAPFTVEQTSHAVRLVQPRHDGRPAVFHVTAVEEATSTYDGVADDPRIDHHVVLEETALGYVTRSAEVSYGRRSTDAAGALPQQGDLQATATLSDATGIVTDDVYVINEEYRRLAYELGGVSPAPARYFTRETLAAAVDAALADVIEYGTEFSPGTVQARLFDWSTIYFWDAAQSAPMPLGEMAFPPLVHHNEEAIFPQSLVTAVYGTTVTAAMLEAAGYAAAGGYWWGRGNTLRYLGADGYHLLEGSVDPFGGTTANAYDRYLLSVTSITDALGQQVTIVPDYQTTQPASITDVNGNLSQALYDPLGMTVVASIHGDKDGVATGNMDLADYGPLADATFDSVLADPAAYLKGASTYFFYELDCWREGVRQPPRAVTLVRSDFYYGPDGAVRPGTPIRVAVSYVDGAMRQLLMKVEVEAGALVDPERPAGTAGDDVVWLQTSRLAHDDRGDVIRRYLGEATATPDWTPTSSAPSFRYRYDGLHRLVRTDTPKGFYTRSVFRPWSRTYYDEDDTVTTSAYYLDHIDDHDPSFAAERAALVKAAVFADTPTTTGLNPQGTPVETLKIDVTGTGPDRVTIELHDQFWVDIVGNSLRAADARFYDPDDPGTPTHLDVVNVFDMGSEVMSSLSADAGLRLTLRDVMGCVVETWDGRGHQVSTRYDAIRRVVTVAVAAGGPSRIVERMAYGDDPLVNTCNQLVERHDPQGVTTFDAYDILGLLTSATRRVLADYRAPVDWADPATVPLMADSWSLGWAHNAVNQTVEVDDADGSVTRTQFYLNGWFRSVDVTFAGAAERTEVVAGVHYNAQAEAARYVFGNGVVSDYTFDPLDFRPVAIDTTTSTGTVLQRARTTYDPVGNVVSIDDPIVPPPLVDAGTGDEPTDDYTYDATYQLVAATGREAADDGTTLVRYREAYTYDLGSNLTVIDHTVDGDPAAGWRREVVVSASSNHAVPKDVLGDRTPDDFFDASGNLTETAPGTALAWDFRNCLVRVDVPGGAEYHLYDGPGERTRKVWEQPSDEAGTYDVVDTLYVGNLVVVRTGTRTGDTVTVTAEDHSLKVSSTNDLVLVADAPVLPPGPRTMRYQVLNPPHSVVLEVDEDEDLLTFEEFRPFGSTSAAAGTEEDLETKRYRFTTKELDAETGLYYYGARYYLCHIGRWASADPAGAVDGLNLYAYVGNNPVSLLDPIGTNGTPDPRTKPVPIYSLDFAKSDLAQMYTYVTPAHTEYYDELVVRMGQSIYLRPQLTDPGAVVRYHSDVERELWNVLDLHRGLHLGSVPALKTGWEQLVDSYGGAKTGAQLYTALRSQYTKVLNANPVLDFKSWEFLRPPELHHLIYKAIRPEYAVQPWNLMLATRGSTSSGKIGTHEGVFHKLGSVGAKDLYRVLNPGFERLVLSWAGQTASFYPTPVLSPPPSPVDSVVALWSSPFRYTAITGSTSSSPLVSVVSTPVTTTTTPSSSSLKAPRKRHAAKANARKSLGGVGKPVHRRSARIKRQKK
jgi:RHS repeat-associated protein